MFRNIIDDVLSDKKNILYKDYIEDILKKSTSDYSVSDLELIINDIFDDLEYKINNKSKGDCNE